HAHYVKLVDSIISAYSIAEVRATAIRRMKLLGGIDCEIDKIYGLEEEDKLNQKLIETEEKLKKKLGDE
ncbi:hypothetical protein LCGC14_3164590, partial [marine sediment metagenome]